MPRSTASPFQILAAAFCLAAPGAAALAAPPANFDARVEAVRKAAGVPGVAIAIVENGAVTLARGWGVRQLGKPEPVDADTLFLTASTGKAFTAADLAILVDQGRIGWDDPVVDHLPWFQMYDPWVTRQITVRDLLVHWSGLGAGEGDLLWSPDTTRTRAEIVRRLRYLKPAGGFRQGFAYDNVLYMAAGQIIEAVTGQTWEAFTAEHLLTPAGMAHSTSDEPRRLAVADQAWPHARAGGAVRGAGPQRVYPEGFKQPLPILPAGGLAISANDMARWLAIQLAHGALARGGRLFSEAQSKEMWRPVVVQAIGDTPPGFEATRPQFAAYALGWEVQDYKGVKIVWHPGATAGYRAAVVLVPGRNVGFSIFVNAEEDGVVLGLTHELLDHYLGDPPAHWPERYAALVKERTGQALAASKAIEAKRVRVGPSAPLARYAGDYVDAWYGPISIRLENGRLVLDFRQTPGMVGELDHFQYDTFRTRWRDHGLDPAYVTFALGAEGKVDRVTLKPASPGDFSFDYQDLLFTPVNR